MFSIMPISDFTDRYAPVNVAHSNLSGVFNPNPPPLEDFRKTIGGGDWWMNISFTSDRLRRSETIEGVEGFGLKSSDTCDLRQAAGGGLKVSDSVPSYEKYVYL